MPSACNFNPAKKLMAASILIIIMTIFFRSFEERNYFIVIDAGSSGSRCHIYSYHTSWLLPDINQINSIKISPGISSLQNQNEIQLYLRNILDFAHDQVPDNIRSNTPLFLYATAGMRLLSPSEQMFIIDASCMFFQSSSKFYIPNCDNFKVISGKEEGIFGWLTLNYLKKALILKSNASQSETFGFLDMVRYYL